MDITVFVTSWCAACKTELPKIREAANKLGVKVQIADVDRCPVNLKSKCEQVDFVPTIHYEGREVSVSELRKIAGL